MKRRVTLTEGKVQAVAGVRLDGLRIEVRRKPRHKRQFVVVIEVQDVVIEVQDAEHSILENATAETSRGHAEAHCRCQKISGKAS